METLEEARLLAKTGHWNGCVNRLYYACFYAVSALLVNEGLYSKTHSGVRALFSQHFVATGRITEDFATFYGNVFASRMDTDYGDMIDVAEGSVRPWIP
jgi:uncharacterized protein (UPF0332 family)